MNGLSMGKNLFPKFSIEFLEPQSYKRYIIQTLSRSLALQEGMLSIPFIVMSRSGNLWRQNIDQLVPRVGVEVGVRI